MTIMFGFLASAENAAVGIIKNVAANSIAPNFDAYLITRIPLDFVMQHRTLMTVLLS
jgi:hypothetical protein